MTQKSRIPLLAEFRLSILAGFAVLALMFFACDDKKPCPVGSSNIASTSINLPPFESITSWVGTGSDSATLTVIWNDGKTPDTLTWGYLFDKTNDIKNKGISMVQAVAKADPRFFALIYATSSIDTANGDSLGVAVGGLGYDLNNNGFFKLVFNDSAIISPNANGLFITYSYDFDDYKTFDMEDHWQSGWVRNGYWSYYISDNGDDFTYSPVGASTRDLDNRSRDLWDWVGFSSYHKKQGVNNAYSGKEPPIKIKLNNVGR